MTSYNRLLNGCGRGFWEQLQNGKLDQQLLSDFKLGPPWSVKLTWYAEPLVSVVSCQRVCSFFYFVLF
jgi:hypothetical protein